MSKLRSLLVGTGGWAESHAKAYKICSGVELVGVCGHRNIERLNHLADSFAIPNRSTDLDDLIVETRPDILDVACNPKLRLDAVRAALVPSIKLINLEKPLALSAGDAYEIERLCTEHDKLLTVNHQTMLLPAWKKARKSVADGRIGDLRLIRSSCQGNLLEQGTHLVDAAISFAGSGAVRWVMGQVDELEGFDKESAAAPDAGIAEVCFENGVHAFFDFGSVGESIPGSASKWYNFFTEIYGSEGHVRVTLNNTLETVIYDDGRAEVEESSWDSHHIRAQAEHLNAAARYVENPAEGHISDLQNSMESFNIIMAIYASALGEGRVTFPRRFPSDLVERLRNARRLRE